MTLQRFNGDEVFDLKEATVDFYIAEDRSFATTFRADAATPPIKALPDTEGLHAQPFAELMLYLPKHPGITLLTGRSCALARGYDDASGEHLTNFYYCEHELVDNVEITVINRHADRARLRITGTTVDVNYYDGSKPPTKILIDAEFTLTFAQQAA
jgi:hypothetical protein